MLRRAELRGIAHHHVPDIRDTVQQMLGWALVGAILGARLFFVLTHLDVYLDDPLSILAIYEGGLTFLGALAGAILLALPFALRRGLSPTMLLDSAAPGLALGLVIGRLGDLAIGDHIGAPAGGFPLAWRCTGNYWQRATNSFGYVPPDPYPSGLAEAPTAGCFEVAVHQTALYDVLAAAVVLALLLLLERRARFDGFFVAVFVYGYGLLRFLSDFARQDRLWIGLTGSQWAILATAAGLAIYLARTGPWRRRPWAWDREFDHPWLHPPDDEAADGHDDEGPTDDASEVSPSMSDPAAPTSTADDDAATSPSERDER